jgi:hypothetical protein
MLRMAKRKAAISRLQPARSPCGPTKKEELRCAGAVEAGNSDKRTSEGRFQERIKESEAGMKRFPGSCPEIMMLPMNRIC